VFGWRCRFLAEGLAERFNIPLDNLIHLPYHELEYITFAGTFADVTGGARQFLDNAAIIPRLFRENPLAALQALQEFGCRNSDTVLGQMALTLSRTYPQILNPGAPAPPGPPGWRLPPWLIPVAGGVAVGVGAAILWDELTRPLEFRLSGFDQKVGSLAGHLAKLLDRNVAGYPPSDPNPDGRANRSWCITIRRIIREIDGADYSERQLNRDLEQAGFAGGRWSEIIDAVKEVVDKGLCDDHWGDFTGGSLATR
jgi:hypothetical protein